MNALFRVFAALLALDCFSCGMQLQWMPTNRSPRALVPRDPASVEIFTTAVPSDGFTEIGIIDGGPDPMSGGTVSQNQEILTKMRDLAAEKGCDGLILTGADTNYWKGQVHAKNYQAACIVWTSRMGAEDRLDGRR